ncbi:hypothetical protein BMS3Bbin15_00564 [archaeon BMS3Bbin15]|nr:hypothetical protein BMS3Bbin15_00564 [archaeon BMS3Bbin15]
MKLKTSFLVLKTDNTVKENASRLRGYIGNKFKEYSILHHHIKEMVYLYTYPRVQYKIIGGTASILGIEEGAEVLKKISDELGELLLNNSRYRIKQKVFYEQEVEVRPSGKRQYRFVMPWLALNPDNYMAYQNMKDWKEKKEFLNGILVGNILSMCKGLGIVVDRRLYAHSYLDTVKVEYKGVPVMGFTGEFRVNFIIPDFFGLGKGVSQGFGVVKNAPSDR